MANLVLETTKNAAIDEIKALIEFKTLECMARGWTFRPTDNAPENFKELKARAKDQIIPVADYGCDKSIYKNNELNIKFRFWHDVTHLEINQGFSVAGETAVIDSHMQDAKKFGLSPLALEILKIDTLGQVLYYDKFKEFVDDQSAWLDSCLTYGIKRALGFKH